MKVMQAGNTHMEDRTNVSERQSNRQLSVLVVMKTVKRLYKLSLVKLVCVLEKK